MGFTEELNKQKTLQQQLAYEEQQAAQEGLAGQAYQDQAAQEQELAAIVELLAKGTPPEAVVQAGYSIELVKMAIQMLSAQTEQQAPQEMVPDAPVNEGLAAGIRNY